MISVWPPICSRHDSCSFKKELITSFVLLITMNGYLIKSYKFSTWSYQVLFCLDLLKRMDIPVLMSEKLNCIFFSSLEESKQEREGLGASCFFSCEVTGLIN